MDSLVQEVKDRRQRQSLLELDRHGMELRPLTHAFMMLSKRNGNWWLAEEGGGQGEPTAQQQSQRQTPTSSSNNLNQRNLQAIGGAGGQPAGPRSEAANSTPSNTINNNRPRSASSNTYAQSIRSGGGGGAGNGAQQQRNTTGLTGAQQHLQTLQSQWVQTYGGGAGRHTNSSSSLLGRQRPMSASGRFGGGVTSNGSSAAHSPLAGSMMGGGAKKTANPAFDTKTADAIQLGLALAAQQKADVERNIEERRRQRQFENAVRRHGEAEARAMFGIPVGVPLSEATAVSNGGRQLGATVMSSGGALSPNGTVANGTSLNATALEAMLSNTRGGGLAGTASMQRSGGGGGAASVYSYSAASNFGGDGRQRGAAAAPLPMKVDPFQAAPIPSLVDDPTEWLRQWQKQSEEKKRFSKEGNRSKLAEKKRAEMLGINISGLNATPSANLSGARARHPDDDDGLGEQQQSAPPPKLSIGADIIIPDTIVWENNIPKGWFYYDKKERLVCKRKVDTKAVQLALLDGAKYENDVVAVLYVLGQSTLGGGNLSSAHNKSSPTSALAHKGALNKAKIGASARRHSAASTTATSAYNRSKARRDSLMTSSMSDVSRRRSSTVVIDTTGTGGGIGSSDDDYDAEEADEERAHRLAHIKKLKAQRYLGRADAELTDDVQSRILHCRFITASDLPSFLFDVGGRFREKGTCILQKFIYSVDAAHLDTFQAVWTPAATQVTRRQNVNNLFDERIPVFQRCTTIEGTGAEHYTQSVQITSKTREQVKAACEVLAQHFGETNPKFLLTRMICHFRLAGTLQQDSGNDGAHRANRLVFLFCSSSRVMPADTKHYNRRHSRFRVALDVDVPIIVDEGEVAQAQSRLIALGTGPDGRPVNEDDPYADVTSDTTRHNNLLNSEKQAMLHQRYHMVSTEAQNRRERNPYKTTNLGNAAFTQSVMVAATGAGAGGGPAGDPTDNTNGGAMLQSFLEANRQGKHSSAHFNSAHDDHNANVSAGGSSPSRLQKATVDKSLDKAALSLIGATNGPSTPRHTKARRMQGNSLHDNHLGLSSNGAQRPANVLYDSVFAASNNNSNTNRNATSPARGGSPSPASPLMRRASLQANPLSPFAHSTNPQQHHVSVKAVMEHVVTTENYLKGVISAGAATGGRGFQRVGEEPHNPSDSLMNTMSSSMNRSGGMRSGSIISATARRTSQFHNTTNFTSSAGSATDSPRSPRGGGGGGGRGVVMMVPRPKMLVGMNPHGTRHLVERTIGHVGLAECRAAYLDTIPEKYLTEAEKAELLFLKFSALAGDAAGSSAAFRHQQQPSKRDHAHVSGTFPLSAANSDAMRLLNDSAELDDEAKRPSSSSYFYSYGGGGGGGASAEEANALLKASFLECAKDHLMAIVYDCYSYYDAYRAALARDAATRRGDGPSSSSAMFAAAGDALSACSSDTFTFYLSPAIETPFRGKSVRPRDVAKVSGAASSHEASYIYHSLGGGNDGSGDDDSDGTAPSSDECNDDDDTYSSGESSHGTEREMTATDLLDKYKPLRNAKRRHAKERMLKRRNISLAHERSGKRTAASSKTKVNLPPMCAPVEALFAVYLSRLQRFRAALRKRDGSAEDAHLLPLLPLDTFLADDEESERFIIDGDVAMGIIKIDDGDGEEGGGAVDGPRRRPKDEPKKDGDDDAFEADSDDENNKHNTSAEGGVAASSKVNTSVVAPSHHATINNPRQGTDAFATLILNAKASELPSAPHPPGSNASSAPSPVVGPSAASAHATPSGHPLAPFTPPAAGLLTSDRSGVGVGGGRSPSSKTATIIEPLQSDALALMENTAAAPPPAAVDGSRPVTNNSSKATDSKGYLNLNTIFSPSKRVSVANAKSPFVTRTGSGGGAVTSNGAGTANPHRFGLMPWLRQYYSWDPKAMSAHDDVLEIQIGPRDEQQAFRDDVLLAAANAIEQQQQRHKGTEKHEEAQPAAAAAGDSDSDFSDVDAPQTLLLGSKAADAKPRLTEGELKALQRARQEEKEAAMVAKRAARSREQLNLLSRRMPQLLHHYVLSFLEELKKELREVRVEERDIFM